MATIRAYAHFKSMEHDPETRARVEQLEDQLRRIKAGESTGNRAQDFEMLFLLEHYLDEKHPIQDIAAKVEVGKPVLTIEMDESIHGCPGIIAPPEIRPEFLGIDTTLRLGIISAELDYDLKHPKLIIPTGGKHVRKYSGHNQTWELNKGDIALDTFHLLHLGETPQHRRHSVPNTLRGFDYQHGLHLLFGEEVDAFFRNGCRFQPSPFREDNALDLTYVEALRLLGQTPSPDMQKRYDQDVYEKRSSVVRELYVIMVLIARNEEIVSKRTYGWDEEQRKSAAEDRVKGHKKDMRDVLKQAEELGMHNCDMVYEGPEPGIKIEVAPFVNGLREKYQQKPK
ncbi:hypothetical protein JW898_05680 [Candidatus Woesearchaeota archaeon]|nr:hypothetical protein [Candidatus Woesearchaeota archaeon]